MSSRDPYTGLIMTSWIPPNFLTARACIVRYAHTRATPTGKGGPSAAATDHILDGQDDGHTLPPSLPAPAYRLAPCTQPLFLHQTPHSTHQPQPRPEPKSEPKHHTHIDTYLFIRDPHAKDDELFDGQDEILSVGMYACARPQGPDGGASRSEEEYDEADGVRAHDSACGGASQD